MKPFGTHLIAEFGQCAEGFLDDQSTLETLVRTGIEHCHLNLKSINSHKFIPIGVTVIAIIGESHICIHTYPEFRHASIDVFTCAANSKAPITFIAYLKEVLKPEKVVRCTLLRGEQIEVLEQ